MRREFVCTVVAGAALLVSAVGALAQTMPPTEPTAPVGPPLATQPPELAIGVTIDWQVKNRFRLFREEKDFLRHVTVERGRSVLAAEQTLALASGGRGWARDMVVRLCVEASGRIPEECMRDGVREAYLTPADHAIEARVTGQIDPGATCAWTFEDADSLPRSVAASCREPVNLRVVHGKPTMATVDIAAPGGPTRRASGEILVRDLLIAGLGDSVASGEGNPDRPVALADDGFCFRQFGTRTEYFRPGRLGYKGDKACDSGRGADSNRTEWSRLGARWMSAACHRSLYSYQLRAALALAIESPRVAVTFVPLACTGASIESGLFGSLRARELNCGTTSNASCPSSVPGQLAELRDLLARARRVQPGRALDLVFLTVGANDVDFSGLVADVIIETRAERLLFQRGGIISNIESADSALAGKLPAAFAKLRPALKALVDGHLERVVYVSYGHPALSPEGGSCAGGRDGFDVHPAFAIDGERMNKVAIFVQNRFLPALKALATCAVRGACADAGDRMTFVDAHQGAFAEHGVCARAATDPDFDKECFSPTGASFEASLVEGATAPLVCSRRPSDFRAYAPRARWIRTANDSYFAAMTFPEGVSATMQPSDLHDATWGVLSAVYGGAIHPTAEGHAAMADAAAAAARNVLRLAPLDTSISAEPLPALGTAGER